MGGITRYLFTISNIITDNYENLFLFIPDIQYGVWGYSQCA